MTREWKPGLPRRNTTGIRIKLSTSCYGDVMPAIELKVWQDRPAGILFKELERIERISERADT
jgi:hypothetical protein